MRLGRYRVVWLVVAGLCAYGVRIPASATSELSGTVDILDKGNKHTPGVNSIIWIPGIAQSGALQSGAQSGVAQNAALPSGVAQTATATMPSMASKDKRFAPHVLAVAAGTEVAFPNLDPIFHNVFSLTPENKFDLGLYRKGAAKSARMGAPALVRIYCNIHSDMAAFVMVLDRGTAFTVTDADGGYRFPALPPGPYTVYVWNERTGEQSQKVTIDGTGGAHLDFLLDASAFKPQAHTNKFGRPYPPVSKDVDRY